MTTKATVATAPKSSTKTSTETKAEAPKGPAFGLGDKVLMVVDDYSNEAPKGSASVYGMRKRSVLRGIIAGVVPNKRAPDGFEFIAHVETDKGLLVDESGTPVEVYDLDRDLVRPRTKSGRAELEEYIRVYEAEQVKLAAFKGYSDARIRALAARNDLADRLSSTPGAALFPVYSVLCGVLSTDAQPMKGAKRGELEAAIVAVSKTANTKKPRTLRKIREEALAAIKAFREANPDIVAAEKKKEEERKAKKEKAAANLAKARNAKATPPATPVKSSTNKPTKALKVKRAA